MKTCTTSLILAVALGSVAFAQDSNKPSPFIQASGAYGFFGDFDDAAGVVLNAGVQIKKAHTIEIEAAYFKSGTDDWFVDSVKFMPILAGYRYSASVGPKTQIFLGALAGVTYEKVEINFYSWGSRYSETDSPFTFGGKAGLKHELTSNLAAELTATALRAGDGDLVESGNYGYLSAGLSYRF